MNEWNNGQKVRYFRPFMSERDYGSSLLACAVPESQEALLKTGLVLIGISHESNGLI